MYTAGIDIGGTNTRIALIDEAYEIIERIQFPTDVNNPQATLQKIQEAVQGFSVAIAGVGLSCPGPLDLKQGIILDTPNLKGGWHGLAVSKELSARLKVPVFLENDANLACLAEAVLGQGKDYSYVQFLTISTGLGSGLVIDKKIYQGAHGFAHEIANIPLWRNGPSHGSIYPGGVEGICSGTAITTRAVNAGLDVQHAGDVYSLACSQNQTAMDIMEDAKEYLANTIAIIYAFVDPEIVILGGSVAIKIPGFVEDVEQRVKTKVYPNIRPLVKVVKTNLSEDSGLLGAACLAFLQV
ncbi:ROK family protein [[Clostridium] innocuum]|nr:ROK family protein [Erysipelotrichaceae bacterium]MCR0383095.1 ROK family protein [[Clostridium] innocuum]MCR0414863.1 ROK family protein [[Clostridium] innocuum]MCR0535889.1 ROK family protein [[Clostridium] innocuum]MCR0540025.1 ROK family protein [[Clostridium] innocuum]